MIRDLEALLLEVRDSEVRAYIAEAVSCYSGRSYRAAVVIAVSSGMEDLRRKLDRLATSGGASADLKKSNSEVQKMFADQQAYEASLIAACAKQAGMLSAAEEKKLGLLLKTRHLCAHPSGHAGSAEEARDAISSIIDLVLSRPGLMGITGVESIIDRIATPLFYPNMKDASAVVDTTKRELAHVDPKLYLALATKLKEKLLVEANARKAASGLTGFMQTACEQNCRLFLGAMTTQSTGARTAVWNGLGGLLQKSPYPETELEIVAWDPHGLMGADELTQARVLAAGKRNLHSPTGRLLAKAWLSVPSDLEASEKQALLEAIRSIYVDSYAPVNPAFLEELGLPEIERDSLKRLIDQCGSGTWAIANPAIQFVEGLHASALLRCPWRFRRHIQ